MTLRDALTATGCTCEPEWDVDDNGLDVLPVHDCDCFWSVTLDLSDLRALTAG